MFGSESDDSKRPYHRRSHAISFGSERPLPGTSQALVNDREGRVSAAPFIGVAELEFEEIEFPAEVPTLDLVVTLARTVRNNLFHGGKAREHLLGQSGAHAEAAADHSSRS